MRKFAFLAIIFTLSQVISAQTQFVEHYSKEFSSETKEWSNCNASVIYNLDNSNYHYVIYYEGETFIFKRVSHFEDNETHSGYKYKQFTCINVEDGTEVIFQKFQDKKFGLRLFFKGGVYIQLVE